MLLIVSQSRSKAVTISDIFYFMRILSYPCTPSEALNEISELYRAVLVVEPKDLPNPADFVRRIRSYVDIPVFAIADDTQNCPDKCCFDKVYRNAILSSTLTYDAIEYARNHDKPYIGKYVISGINSSFNRIHPTYHCQDVFLTKTERMIISFLIITFPLKQSNDNIIKYAFPNGRKPQNTSIRTHISQINSKFRKLSGYNIIGNIPGKGYHLITSKILNKTETIL